MRSSASPSHPLRAGARPSSTLVRRLCLPALALALGATTACVHSSRAAADAAAQTDETELLVQNQAFLDMNIYVLRGPERVRIGQARSNGTTKLRIPPSMLTGPTPLRFLADPIGSSRTPISSELVVNPGEQVSLVIPPS